MTKSEKPLEGAQEQKGWVSEPDWPTQPRNASYLAGLRDAQNAFRYMKVKTFKASRAGKPVAANPPKVAVCPMCGEPIGKGEAK